MQTAGDFIRSLVEFATGMQFGKHDLGSGNTFRRMNIDRDPATVVAYSDAVVDMDRDIDLIAMTDQRFVNGVVDDLVDQMMKTPLRRIADVHPGAFSDGFQPLQYFDIFGVVF